jgi:hypothetical protein
MMCITEPGMAVRRRRGLARQHHSRREARLLLFALLAALSVFTTSSSISASISGAGSGLLAYYTFDQTSGTTAVDSSGNARTGTLNGPAWTSGRVGSGALLFDNANDRVSLPLDIPGAKGPAITVSAWVRPSTIANGGVIVAKDRSGFTQWTLRMDGRGGNNLKNNLVFAVGAGGKVVTAISDSEVMADLNWHHVVGVYDGAQVYVYMDGTTRDSTPNLLTGTITNYSHQVCIGTSGATCNESAFFGGLIDDVRVYSRALTPAEIWELYSYDGTIVPPAPDATPPTIAITAPAQAAQVSGTLTVSAQATDNIGVVGVQFTVDEVNLSGEDTTAPYGVSWNTASAADGLPLYRASLRHPRPATWQSRGARTSCPTLKWSTGSPRPTDPSPGSSAL